MEWTKLLAMWRGGAVALLDVLLTSRSSSLVGVWVRLRLSSMAFLNSADWATMLAVVWFELLVCQGEVFSVGTVVGRELESGMPNDVISAHPQLLDLVGRWTAGLIIRLHRDDALGIK
jgi:hypothetical protein